MRLYLSKLSYFPFINIYVTFTASSLQSASFTALTSSKTSAGRTGYTDYHTKKKVPKMVLRQLRRNKVPTRFQIFIFRLIAHLAHAHITAYQICVTSAKWFAAKLITISQTYRI